MRRKLVTMVLGFAALMSTSALAQEPFLGEIDLVGFNFAPTGWAMCDGQLLSIAQNTALFSLIGTIYGGDGINTFALPDLQGRRAISSGQGGGLQNYIVGQLGGEEVVTLNISQMPSHAHTFFANSAPGNAKGLGSGFWASASQVNLYSTGGTLTGLAPQAVGLAGGGQPHNNMPPYLVLNYIIALQGIYPARN